MNLEKKLVSALNSKDKAKIESVFRQIYDSYFKLVYFCISNYISVKEDIEDIVADVFLSFFNHLDSINVDGSIKYYLTTTAKNKSINFVKKKKEIMLDENIAKDVSYETKPNLLLLAINENLDKDEKYIVISHVLYDYTLNEIVTELNENLNTIKSKYRRTIQKLKKILGGKEYE